MKLAWWKTLSLLLSLASIASVAADANPDGTTATLSEVDPQGEEQVWEGQPYQNIADKYAQRLRAAISCATWDVVAVKYEDGNQHVQSSIRPTYLFLGIERPSRVVCLYLGNYGIVMKPNRPNNDEPAAWVIAFYWRTRAPPPVTPRQDASDAVQGLLELCRGSDVTSADSLIQCSLSKMNGGPVPFRHFLLITGDLSDTIAVNSDYMKLDWSQVRLNYVWTEFFVVPK